MTDAPLPRIRQVVLAAWDLEDTAATLRDLFGVPEGFHDPGVGEFGLVNEVLAVGNTFVEVVAPVQAGGASAAGRFLQKTGDRNGYMAIFQVADQEAARARIADAGIRVVWRMDLPRISGTHLHPADIGGAIVSIDTTSPAAGVDSWLWAGPDWERNVRTDRVRAVVGIDVAATDPAAMAARWATAVGADLATGATSLVLADGGDVVFRPTAPGEREGIVGYRFRATDPTLAGTTHVVAGTDLHFV